MNEYDHSYEEIRDAAVRVLARDLKKRQPGYGVNQYQILRDCTGQLLNKDKPLPSHFHGAHLTNRDGDLFLEVFWGLFRDGLITLGVNDDNRNFPFLRVTQHGEKILNGHSAYFFHDLSSYERIIRTEVPDIDDVTLLYLMEGMQAFRSGCLLSATVMIGVATEHTFLRLVETIEANATHASTYAAVAKKLSQKRTCALGRLGFS